MDHTQQPTSDQSLLPPASQLYVDVVVSRAGRIVVESVLVTPADGECAATLSEQIDRINAAIDAQSPAPRSIVGPMILPFPTLEGQRTG